MPSAIHYRQSGDLNAAPIVVLHGLFGSLENLGVISKNLAESYCVYALDLPNHGRSAHTQDINLMTMAEAIVSWMDSIELNKAHFLGHSLGGKISMEIALRYPDKVDCLLVADIAPVAYTRRHDDVFAAFAAVDLDVIQSRMDADQAMRPHVSELSTRSFLLKNLEKSDQGWSWRVNLTGLIHAYEQLIDANSTGFPPAEHPVLFIKGEHSLYILPEHRQPILNLFPKASVKIINGTHHWLHAEKPDIFTGIVMRFLEANS